MRVLIVARCPESRKVLLLRSELARVGLPQGDGRDGEDPEHAASRLLQEQTGLIVTPEKFARFVEGPTSVVACNVNVWSALRQGNGALPLFLDESHNLAREAMEQDSRWAIPLALNYCGKPLESKA